MPRKKNSTDSPTYYTTHQVAKHLGVSLPTVVNWVEAGLLKAHRTPGGHRRIAHQDMLLFARQNDYPLSRELLTLESSGKRVLIVDDERDFSEMVREYLVARGDFEVEVANTGFRAGVALARSAPDLVLIDVLMPDLDVAEVRQVLYGDVETRSIALVAIVGHRTPEIEQRIREHQFDGVIEKPLMLDALLDMIRAMLSP